MPATVGTPFDLGAVGLGGQHGEVTSLQNGNLFVVWANTVNPLTENPGTDNEGTAVVGRIFAPDGTPVTNHFQVNTTEAFFQLDAEITTLDNGNVVIAWTDTPFGDAHHDARARIYTPDGTAVTGEITLASVTDGTQNIPQIAARPDGGFMAIWEDSRTEIYGQYFNDDGTRDGPEFNVPAFAASRISLAVLDDGGVRYVNFEDLWYGDGSVTEFEGGYFGLNAGSVSTLDTPFLGNFESAISALSDNRYVIAGVVKPEDGQYQVAIRVHDGNNFDNAIVVEGIGNVIPVSDTFPIVVQQPVNVDVSALASGGLVVTWGQYAGDGTSERFEVRARAFGPDLLPIGDPITLHSPATDSIQIQPFVTEMADGRIFVGWTDLSTEIGAEPYALVGTFIETLDGSTGGGTGTPGVITGTDGDDTLEGTDGDDEIYGLDGNDSLIGAAGNDLIAASAGNDTVDGGPDNDNIGGGPGDDSIDGGDGDDIIGAGLGNDVVNGGAGNDGVFGGGGDDTLSGGDGDDNMGASFGADVLDGGAGNDDMGGGTGADSIDGSDGNDSIGGGEGDDVIDGGAGDDFLAGGGRNDLIDGGTGDDQINAGNGDDTMTGGAGADVFVFNGFNDGDADVITDFEDGTDMLRMTGVTGAAGTGLAGKVAALNITDISGGVMLTYEGHTIEIQGVDAADLTTDDFMFL